MSVVLNWLSNNAAAIIAIGIFALFFSLMYNAWRLPRRLRSQYRTLFCLTCGYDLSVRTTDRCPECGDKIPFKQKRFLNEL